MVASVVKVSGVTAPPTTQPESTPAPQTKIKKGPKKVVRTAKKKAKVWENPAAGKKKVRPSGVSPLRADPSLQADPPRSCSGRFGRAMIRKVPSLAATARTKTSPWS